MAFCGCVTIIHRSSQIASRDVVSTKTPTPSCHRYVGVNFPTRATPARLRIVLNKICRFRAGQPLVLTNDSLFFGDWARRHFLCRHNHHAHTKQSNKQEESRTKAKQQASKEQTATHKQQAKKHPKQSNSNRKHRERFQRNKPPTQLPEALPTNASGSPASTQPISSSSLRQSFEIGTKASNSHVLSWQRSSSFRDRFDSGVIRSNYVRSAAQPKYHWSIGGARSGPPPPPRRAFFGVAAPGQDASALGLAVSRAPDRGPGGHEINSAESRDAPQREKDGRLRPQRAHDTDVRPLPG